MNPNLTIQTQNSPLIEKEVVKFRKPKIIQGKFWFHILLTISFVCLSSFLTSDQDAWGQSQTLTDSANASDIDKPFLIDSSLKIESIATGFDFPTSIAFLGNNDFLLLEKNTGNIFRVVDSNMSLVTHLNVSFKDERGLLGITVKDDNKSKNGDKFVFLFYTYCPKVKTDMKDASDDCGNYVYRYKFDSENNKLLEPKLILKLSALPGPSHNGGVLIQDNEENLFATTGDVQSTAFNRNQTGYDTKAQNIINGTFPDGRAGILRFTSEGKPVGNGVLGKEYPLNLYYAYGIKNSFGIGIDPISGWLWDTENGPQFGDEINLVDEGFNSGWEKVQGIWKLNQTRARGDTYYEGDNQLRLEDFDGKGKYSSPEFVWDKPVGPTALIFLGSDKLGEKYKNDMFVGSVKKGKIYHFDLSNDRKSLLLEDDLADLMLNKKDDSSKIIFGENFGIITDLEVGPDGYLYVVSGIRGTDEGAVYRIVK
jgi:glucose/arabinose dehydrogenase